ncbi:(d)CMP kinase [Simkania sp.]|uniref:(d)CMP kinase n=1 Tax=Simkania sp. TaxID=34094 RepID=UPI003B52422B
MIVTIDGPSGTGKSTVAEQLAERLGYTYFDTGALYRAISWKILHDDIVLSDLKAIEKMLQTFSFHVETHEGRKTYKVDTHDVTKAIRSQEVTAIVSEVSAMKCVRDAMRPLQELFSHEGPTVFEGRDLGTVVFPHAQVKFFLTASASVRAERRLKDLQQKFPDRASEFSYEDILQKIQERDAYDSSRKLAPLKQADDAILVDTSQMTIDEVVATLENYVKEKSK